MNGQHYSINIKNVNRILYPIVAVAIAGNTKVDSFLRKLILGSDKVFCQFLSEVDLYLETVCEEENECRLSRTVFLYEEIHKDKR